MLELQNIYFSYGTEEIHNLQNINFKIAQGSHVAIMGESGCGKSTLLKYIYGLLPYSKGAVLWNDTTLKGAQDHLVPGHGMMKYVPQEFALMPYTTVAENVGEFLSIQLNDRKDRIAALLEVVDMTKHSAQKVKTLSGGQKQRVAIAKALAQEPKLLLLDEPFSHIDHFRRSDIRRRLFKYLNKRHISCLMATHDHEDVLGFTQRTIIMKDGAIIDHRDTKDVYKMPLSYYGASLFDDVNLIPSRLVDNDGVDKILYPHQLKVAPRGFEAVVSTSYYKGKAFLIEATVATIGPIFFLHHEPLEPNTVIKLKCV